MNENIKNIKFLANNINYNKLNNLCNHKNYKLLIYEIINMINNIYPKINSKKFMYNIIEANKNKIYKYGTKINIKEFLNYLYIHNIISSYSEDNIKIYSDDIAYDYIFLLDAKPRFIILLFLYFGLIKDITQQSYLENLNAAIDELFADNVNNAQICHI